MLKQVSPTKPENSNASIDLTDDIEDGANQSFQGTNVTTQPPALVVFRGTPQKTKTKPTKGYTVERKNNLNKSNDQNVVTPVLRNQQNRGKCDTFEVIEK